MRTILEFEDVRYTYPGGRSEALCGLTLQVPEGKKCVLLGHNGCGKSTLFLNEWDLSTGCRVCTLARAGAVV